MCWECWSSHQTVPGSSGHVSGTREQLKLYLLASACTWITFIALLWAKAKTLGLSLQFEFVAICFTPEMHPVRFVFPV